MLDSLFVKLTNNGSGNCLFHSLSQSLHSLNGYGDAAATIREKVANFYETFSEECHIKKGYDETTDYQNTLEFNLAIGLIGNEEHKEKISNQGEWGTSIDIISFCLIYNVNVVSFNLFKRKYVAIPYKCVNPSGTIFIKYSGNNHYESFIPKLIYNTLTAKSLNCITRKGMVLLLNSTGNIRYSNYHRESKKIEKKAPDDVVVRYSLRNRLVNNILF